MRPIRNMLGGVEPRSPLSPQYGESAADAFVGRFRQRSVKEMLASPRPIAGGAPDDPDPAETDVNPLLEERAKVWGEMQETLEAIEKDGYTAESRSKYDKLEERLTELTGDIHRAERAKNFKKQMDGIIKRDPIINPGEPDKDDPDTPSYRKIFDRWVRRGMVRLNEEERSIMQGRFEEIEGDLPAELRALATGTGSAGGYAVPQEFRNTVTESLKDFSGMRQVSEILETESGADLPWPAVDETGVKGARLAENTAATEQDPVFTQKTLRAFMYTSKIVRVPFQLLQDERVNLEDRLSRWLADRIGRIQNEEFTIGAGGTGAPEGIVTGAAIGKTGAAGQVASVIYDDLVDLIYSVNSAYRASGRCKWMLGDTSIGRVAKLKDADGRPLWQPSLIEGRPDTLMGYGIQPNDDMPAMGANNKSILFGDFFRAYVIRDVLDFFLLRLEERFAEFAQVGFIGFQRSDGRVQDAGAVKAYAHPAA